MKIKKTNSVQSSTSLSLSLDLTDTRACCCCCSNQLGIIIPWGLHEVLGGLRQHLLVVHTSFPPMYYYVQPPPPDTRWYVDEIRLIHCLNLDLSNQNGTKEMCIGVRSSVRSSSFCRTWGEHVVYKNCSECQKQFLYTTCSPQV